MSKPYGRIIVLHLTVLLGGAGVVLGLHGPAGAILILCLLKAVLEVDMLGWRNLSRPGVRIRRWHGRRRQGYWDNKDRG